MRLASCLGKRQQHTLRLAHSQRDTIYASSTAPGKAAIAIVRISGSDALQVWHQMTRSPKAHRAPPVRPPVPRRASLRQVVDPVTQDPLDEALVLYFPRSVALTGQDLVELHLHGSRAVTRAVLEALSKLSDHFRPAEPGEFTQRAYESGKMDLTAVEGLRDLIESETEAQRQLALAQATGSLHKQYELIRQQLIEAMALIEAIIDFGEDENIEDGVIDLARAKVASLRETLQARLTRSRSSEIVRQGIRVAILGPPNAGKSTLFNWLVQREASIVTAHPGTTRDIIQTSLDFHGYPLVLLDTAGLRQGQDVHEVEQIGITRALEAASSADLKLCVLPLDQPTAIPRLVSSSTEDALVVFTKSDLVDSTSAASQVARYCALYDIRGSHCVVSVKTGDGLFDLSQFLQRCCESRFGQHQPEAPLVTQARHRHHLEDCLACLAAFEASCNEEGIVLAAEELRYAAQAIGRITGRVEAEEVLGQIFSSFCIGK
ncbi:hypothetical protein E5Q_00440 [Mixia osmundae IAM 14324]|uniref:TrmE-type G domain-containing protein n=1 Tax=Mixia osmundae (strain CBS 9802 / IAM 14324 / JCM 22182 / KY 12970) TaxID=764103 RepID=G7DTE7_MIXOS|nr:hypothetical protein E5Q_00440 [Mixia osmundae IAM 14324]